jgi:hypothetical protein
MRESGHEDCAALAGYPACMHAASPYGESEPE